MIQQAHREKRTKKHESLHLSRVERNGEISKSEVLKGAGNGENVIFIVDGALPSGVQLSR